MGFHELEENLIDMVKEQQAKLGFRPEVIRLYYPVSTLNHFFGTDDTPERMEERLQELGVHTKDTLGAVQVTAKGDRFCIKIPEEGSVFVHEQMKGREFIQDLVELVGRHGCSLDEIRELFLKASSAFNAIGTCVSMPVNPTMAGMLREMPSIPYSPCIMEETGRMDRSLRMMHSQIRLTLMAIP